MDNNLKEIRNSRHLTLVQLSELTDIPRATLSRYENGASEPKKETWEHIAKILGVSAGYLSGFEKNTKSYNEILYNQADPIKIGKIIKFIRKNYPGSVRAFKNLVNDTMKNFGFEPNLLDKDIEKWESGEILPSLNQLYALSHLDNLDLTKVLSGDIRNVYHEQPIKKMLTNMSGEINELALKDLVSALNETSIINFSIPDILQMYNQNVIESHSIYDKRSLIHYLEEKRDGLLHAENDETLPWDIRMDIAINSATITEDLNRISIYEEVFQ